MNTLSLFGELAIELLLILTFELRQKVHFIHFVQTLIHLRLLPILKVSMDGDGTSLPRKVVTLVIGHPLVVIVETHVFLSQHLEAPHLPAVLFGQVDEVAPVLLLRVGVVDHH